MNKEFIPYEQSLELKELGFDEPCFAWFNDEEYMLGIDEVRFDTFNTYHYNNTYSISAPLYQQVFRWFREKYRLYFSNHYSNLNHVGKWQWLISYEDNAKASGFTDTYEQAELECLNKLIEIVKQQQ